MGAGRPLDKLEDWEVTVGWLLKWLFKVLLATAILMGLWLAVPSSLFFHPTSVSIEDGRVTVARSFPMSKFFGGPYIKYTETVRAIGGSVAETCSDTDEFRYLPDGATASWDITEWAEPCMVKPYLWRANWQVHLFDLIPLRPVEMDLLVKVNPEADN